MGEYECTVRAMRALGSRLYQLASRDPSRPSIAAAAVRPRPEGGTTWEATDSYVASIFAAPVPICGLVDFPPPGKGAKSSERLVVDVPSYRRMVADLDVRRSVRLSWVDPPGGGSIGVSYVDEPDVVVATLRTRRDGFVRLDEFFSEQRSVGSTVPQPVESLLAGPTAPKLLNDPDWRPRYTITRVSAVMAAGGQERPVGWYSTHLLQRLARFWRAAKEAEVQLRPPPPRKAGKKHAAPLMIESESATTLLMGYAIDPDGEADYVAAAAARAAEQAAAGPREY